MTHPPATPDAIVIGGGIAGCTAVAALAARGLKVTLLEGGATLASGASGNPAGALYPLLTAAPSALGEVYAAAFRHTLARLPTLAARVAPGTLWAPCGVLLLPKDSEAARRYGKIAMRAELADIARPVTLAEAAAHAGMDLAATPGDGLLLPAAGWVAPPQLCAALVASASDCLTVRLGTSVAEIQRVGPRWQALAAPGRVLATAGIVVLAAGPAVTRFAAAQHLAVRPNRGQLTLLPATPASERLQAVVCREGYILPAVGGGHVTGATYARDDIDTTPRAADTYANLAKAAAISPAFLAATGVSTDKEDTRSPALPARAAIRATTPDHLPLWGAVAGAAGLFVLSGLGSRGLVTALWAAEQLADTITSA